MQGDVGGVGDIEYQLVNAFVGNEFGSDIKTRGNPALIALCSRDFPSTEEMQQIAREAEQPVTVFLKERRDGTYDVRHFLPGSEITFCGHGTVAATELLRHRATDPNKAEFIFHLNEKIVRDGEDRSIKTSVAGDVISLELPEYPLKDVTDIFKDGLDHPFIKDLISSIDFRAHRERRTSTIHEGSVNSQDAAPTSSSTVHEDSCNSSSGSSSEGAMDVSSDTSSSDGVPDYDTIVERYILGVKYNTVLQDWIVIVRPTKNNVIRNIAVNFSMLSECARTKDQEFRVLAIVSPIPLGLHNKYPALRKEKGIETRVFATNPDPTLCFEDYVCGSVNTMTRDLSKYLDTAVHKTNRARLGDSYINAFTGARPKRGEDDGINGIQHIRHICDAVKGLTRTILSGKAQVIKGFSTTKGPTSICR